MAALGEIEVDGRRVRLEDGRWEGDAALAAELNRGGPWPVYGWSAEPGRQALELAAELLDGDVVSVASFPPEPGAVN